MDSTFVYLILFIIMVEGIAQYFLQKHVDLKELHYLIIGLLLYSGVAYVYYHILRQGQQIVLATTLWAVGSMIMGAFTGWFVFNQKITVRMLVGLTFIFIGAYLML